MVAQVKMASCAHLLCGCSDFGGGIGTSASRLAFSFSFRNSDGRGMALQGHRVKDGRKLGKRSRTRTVPIHAQNPGPPDELLIGADKMAWVGRIFSRGNDEARKKKAEEMDRKNFEEFKRSQVKEATEKLEFDRQVKIQLERNHIQTIMWNKTLRKMRGSLQGTMWDPEDSHPIPYSEFARLLDEDRVTFLEYGEFGKEVAVVLPYYKDEESLKVELDTKNEDTELTDEEIFKRMFPKKSEQKDVVYKRHPVAQMPADGWTDTWGKLHRQLHHVEIKHPNSLPAQLYPTFETVVVWSMRVALAFVLYYWIDKKLYPWYRLPDPSTRPNIRRPKLGVDNFELGSLGESRARFISAEESTGVTFDDFAGQDYVKRELQEVVKILRDSEAFEKLGIYCPKGVMLYGPPGTGKTLLAKAIAGEAGVPFFSASGSEFVEMFVGVAAARVRDLFARARQFAPSIVFIDEIDAIGAKRGGPDIGGQGGVEREQGLVQILTELDGFQSSNAQVLVVGATNRLDMLDPALLRKGRFDKTISVGLPTEEGRLAILRVHARNKAFASEKEKETLLKEIAKQTYDFSGAELQNILNEAAILAARKDKDLIEKAELSEALMRQEGTFATGIEDVMDASGEARLRIAYREAAIAVLECYYPNRWRPFTKTNIRNMDTLPNMEYADTKNRVFSRKEDMIHHVVRACAPRIVEEQIFGRDHLSWISGTALGEAGVLADYMILRSGMTALGKVYYRTQQDLMVHLGPKVVALRDEYMRWAVAKCHSVLREYRSALETIAEVLLENEEVSAAEIWDIFKRTPRISQPDVRPVDEYAVLVDVGRWGMAGVALCGRATFSPGNLGYVTFGAPRPQQLQVIDDVAWKLLDELAAKNIANLAKKHEDDEEEINSIVSAKGFL